MQNNQNNNFNKVRFISRTVGQRPVPPQNRPADRIGLISGNLSRRLKGKTKHLPGWKVFGVMIVFLMLILESGPILSFGGVRAQALAKTGVTLANTVNPTVPSPSLAGSSPQVLAAQTTAATSTGTSAGPSIPTQTQTTEPIGRLIVNSTPTGFLNVRMGPSTNDSIVGKVYPSQVFSYVQSQSGWFKIILKDSQSGWVDGQYVTAPYSSLSGDDSN